MYINLCEQGPLTPNLRRQTASGFPDASGMLSSKDYSGRLHHTLGHPCFLQVLGRSDQADLLCKGSRAGAGPGGGVGARNPSREEDDQAQAS